MKLSESVLVKVQYEAVRNTLSLLDAGLVLFLQLKIDKFPGFLERFLNSSFC